MSKLKDLGLALSICNAMLETQSYNNERRKEKYNKEVEKKIADPKKKTKRKQKQKSQRINRKKK